MSVKLELEKIEKEAAHKKEMLLLNSRISASQHTSPAKKRPAPSEASPTKRSKHDKYTCEFCIAELNDTGNLQHHLSINHLDQDDDDFQTSLRDTIQPHLQFKWENKRHDTTGEYKCPDCTYCHKTPRSIAIHAINCHMDKSANDFKQLMIKVEEIRSGTKMVVYKEPVTQTPLELDAEAVMMRASVVEAVRDAYLARDKEADELKASYATKLVDLALAVSEAQIYDYDEHLLVWQECVKELMNKLRALNQKHNVPPKVDSFFDKYDTNRFKRQETETTDAEEEDDEAAADAEE